MGALGGPPSRLFVDIGLGGVVHVFDLVAFATTMDLCDDLWCVQHLFNTSLEDISTNIHARGTATSISLP